MHLVRAPDSSFFSLAGISERQKRFAATKALKPVAGQRLKRLVSTCLVLHCKLKCFSVRAKVPHFDDQLIRSLATMDNYDRLKSWLNATVSVPNTLWGSVLFSWNGLKTVCGECKGRWKLSRERTGMQEKRRRLDAGGESKC